MASFDEIKIVLRPSPEEPQLFSRETQDNMNAVLSAFYDAGIKTRATGMAFDSIDAVGGFTGEFIALATTLGGTVVGALGTWLASRNGRKVRLKIGDVEAEAKTQEEVEKLLALARNYKRDEEPKRIIHE